MKTEFKPKKQEKREIGKKIEELKNKEWGKQLPYIKELQKEGAEKFFNGRGNLREAFRSRLSKLVCIDEGTSMKKTEGGVFPLAGLGILLPANSEEERLEKAAKIFINFGLNEIESHPGCGAAKSSCKRDNPEKEPTQGEVDAKAKGWAEKLREKIKSKGKKTEVNHILDEKMLRPKEIHNAVSVYYDGTGKFNPGHLESIPQGFVISRGGLEESLGGEAKDYCGQELGIACSIALGPHGFGKFCKETPFTIIAIGKNPEHLGALKREVKGFIESSDSKKDLERGRIKIDGFTPEGL